MHRGMINPWKIKNAIACCCIAGMFGAGEAAAELVHGLEINSQLVDVGPRTLVCSYANLQNTYTQTKYNYWTTYFNPAYVPGCGLFIDAPLATVKSSNSAMTFFSSGMIGLDVFLNATPAAPFGVPQCTLPPNYVGIADRKGANKWWRNRFAASNVVSTNPRPRNVDTLRFWTNPQNYDQFDQDDTWMPNMYLVTQADVNSVNQHHPGSNVQAGDILGFVHVETEVDIALPLNLAAVYSIGIGYLAYSDYSKSGFGNNQWVYCGDIIRTACNSSQGTNNIEGVPYLVVTSNGVQFLYAYYNEFSDPLWFGHDFTHGKRQSVARDTLYDVLYKARKIHDANRPSRSNPVPVFFKYAVTNKNGVVGWTKNDATGKGGAIDTGAQLLPKCPDVPVPFPYASYHWAGPDSLLYDFTSDAAYCTPLKKFLMTATNGPDKHSPFGALMMYFSDDGIQWNNPILIDTTTGTGDSYIEIPHSCLVASLADADPLENDSHVIGSQFDILFAHTHWETGGQELYRRHISISYDLLPNAVRLIDTK